MQLNVNIGYDEIYELVKQLSKPEIEKLYMSIRNELINAHPQKNKKSKLEELVFDSPTLSDEEYAKYLGVKEHFKSRLT